MVSPSANVESIVGENLEQVYYSLALNLCYQHCEGFSYYLHTSMAHITDLAPLQHSESNRTCFYFRDIYDLDIVRSRCSYKHNQVRSDFGISYVSYTYHEVAINLHSSEADTQLCLVLL
jgi:hypothetical protein